MTITLTREEAQQVLDALDEYYITTDEGKQLIETLRARLSAPEPEPVAWMHSLTGGGWQVVPEKKYPTDRPLYTAPPQPEPYRQQADAVFAETNGRMRIDPVTGNVGIGWASGPEPAETNERLRIGQDAMTWYDGQGNVTMKIDASGPLVISPHPAFAKSQRVYCSCGDGIVPDDGALCGTCVSLKEKREWVGLTDEEMSEAYNMNYNIYKEHVEYVDFVLIYRAIEAALRSKNT